MLTWYGLVKIIHYLGLIALFGSFVIYPRAGVRLRSATTNSEVRGWLGLLELTRGMFHGGVVMMLLSGIEMTRLRWGGPYPFVAIGVITLLVAWVFWTMIPGRHLRAVRSAVGESEGAVSTELSNLIRRPLPWAVELAVNVAALGLLLEMTLKLGWPGAIGLVAGGAILGGGVAWFGVQSKNAPAASEVAVR